MKIKQIESILKSSKTIIVYEGSECQWLSNGEAIYPIYNLPPLTEGHIFSMYDIPEDKRDKFYFETRLLPENINFEDIDKDEKLLTRSQIGLMINGNHLEPLEVESGLVYINKKYLKPFSDLSDGYELYVRSSLSGSEYIAVKSGLVLIGIIAPCCVIDEHLIENLKKIYELSEATLFNSKGDKL